MKTNIDEWRGVALSSQPSWEARSLIIAKLLRSSDTVLDLGAGDRKLQRFIPPGCGYIPADCVDDLHGTFVVDFNKEFRLPDEEFSVAVCAGLLEYINDLTGFFDMFSSQKPGCHVIFSYLLDPKKLTRDTMTAHNNFTKIDDLVAAVGRSFSFIDIVATHRQSVIMQGTLNSGNGRGTICRQTLNSLIAEPDGLDRLLSKTRRLIKKHK
jgi:hypothetical protein